jgi:hypothetical protein
MALTVARAEPAVREALKRLGAETHRGASGGLEYLISSDNRDEARVRARRLESAHNESYQQDLLIARDEIADLRRQNDDLKRQLAEALAENARLKAHAPAHASTLH